MAGVLFIPLLIALAIAITAQILWTRHKRRRRRGFPVQPPGQERSP
jgi:hypothetical protein